MSSTATARERRSPDWSTAAIGRLTAVLLVIAVTYERREGEGAGLAARLRDLR